VRVDERLRDRELGVLDRLTRAGVHARFPDEEGRRRQLGKLYYRPPCGESWADVALRLRSFVADELTPGQAGPVVLVAHDAVILLLRYILERMTERQLLDLAAEQSVGNATVTWLTCADPSQPWLARSFGAADHLSRYGAQPTAHGAERDAHPR
jgi:broad specificity phosphatase PhoE